MLEIAEIGNLNDLGQDDEPEDEDEDENGDEEESEAEAPEAPSYVPPPQRKITRDDYSPPSSSAPSYAPDYDSRGQPMPPSYSPPPTAMPGYYQPPTGPAQPTQLPLQPGEPVIPATAQTLINYAQQANLPAADQQTLINLAKGTATAEQIQQTAQRLQAAGAAKAAQAVVRAGLRQGAHGGKPMAAQPAAKRPAPPKCPKGSVAAWSPNNKRWICRKQGKPKKK